MNLITQTDPETGTLKLTGDINIYQTERLKQTLAASIAMGTDLVLDLSGVETCDFTGLQLIYAAARSASMHGHRLVSGSARAHRGEEKMGPRLCRSVFDPAARPRGVQARRSRHA
jgi:anti-anti-sigma factor